MTDTQQERPALREIDDRVAAALEKLAQRSTGSSNTWMPWKSKEQPHVLDFMVADAEFRMVDNKYPAKGDPPQKLTLDLIVRTTNHGDMKVSAGYVSAISYKMADYGLVGLTKVGLSFDLWEVDLPNWLIGAVGKIQWYGDKEPEGRSGEPKHMIGLRFWTVTDAGDLVDVPQLERDANNRYVNPPVPAGTRRAPAPNGNSQSAPSDPSPDVAALVAKLKETLAEIKRDKPELSDFIKDQMRTAAMAGEVEYPNYIRTLDQVDAANAFVASRIEAWKLAEPPKNPEPSSRDYDEEPF